MKLVICLIFLFRAIICNGQPPGVGNFDESKVGNNQLPDLLMAASGKRITSKAAWEQVQRPYILKLFQQNVYGRMPGKPRNIYYCLMEMDTAALNGKAIRKQVTIHFTKEEGPVMNLVMYLPKLTKKVPVFIGLNFLSNPSIDDDIAILPSAYVIKKNEVPVEAKRGEQSRRWPLQEIINNGFGVATAFYQDIEPDNADGWKTGIRTTLQKELDIQPEEWGAIGAWAWGLSRIQDYLETDGLVDASKTIVTGHSRLGKAALWAGVNDKRFAIVISNNSGEGGAALARRNYGETMEYMNKTFPHWFIEKYKSYSRHPENMPVDQHMLLSLIAPRPVYVASAIEDKWSDPKGEFLSLKKAEPAYKLYGLPLLHVSSWPGINHPVGSKYMHYHIRSGKHDILLYDWKQYIDFAKKYFWK